MSDDHHRHRHRHRHSPGSDDHHSSHRHRDGSDERDDDRNRRERSHERNSSAYKRKDKGESQDRAEKRARVSDDVAEESKKERRRFEDKAEKGSNGEQKGRGEMRERSKFEYRVKEEELIDAGEVREGAGFDAEVDKKERRRFGDKAEKGSGGEHMGRGENRESRFEDRMKEEKGIEADEVRRGVSFGSELVKEAKDEPPYDLATNGDSKVTSLASMDGSSRPLSVSSLASNHSTSKMGHLQRAKQELSLLML